MTISGTAATEKTIRTWDLWIMDFWITGMMGRATAVPKAGEYLLIFEKSDGYLPVVAVQDIDPKNPLVGTLSTIARLHSNPDSAAILRDSLSPDDFISEYCLRRLLRDRALPSVAESIKEEPNYLASLKALREDQARTPKVRMLANQLVITLSGGSLGSDSEFQWLIHAIAESPNQIPDIRHFGRGPVLAKGAELLTWLNRLREILPQHEDKAVAFLTAFVTNKAAPLRARTIVMDFWGGLPIAKLPAAQYEQLFTTCEVMMKDSNPRMRGEAAGTLDVLVEDLRPNIPEPTRIRAANAFQSALNGESDVGVIATLKLSLKRLAKYKPSSTR